MKTTQRHNNRRSGFTLIEMVGVLAVIAILAALLVPKIFAAINESRLSNTLGGINTCKTATIQYFTKHGAFPVPSESTINFHTTLLDEGFLDKALQVKLGTAVTCEVVKADNASDGGSGGTGRFDLEGTADVPENATVVQVKIVGVKAEEARELSLRIDGESMSAADTTSADNKGRVAYADPSTTGGSTTVYVYLAHQ